MTFTPHISIYLDGACDYRWVGNTAIKATLIFSSHLGYNRYYSRKRVNIHVGHDDSIHTNGSIKSVFLRNTFGDTEPETDIEKVNLFLKLIYESLVKIFEAEGHDKSILEIAYKLAISDEGKFTWCSQFKTTKNRLYKARIKMSLGQEDGVQINAEVFDKKDKFLYEVLLIETFTFNIDWPRSFEKPIWLDIDKFGFCFMDSQLKIFTDISTEKSEIHIQPIRNSKTEIEGQLRLLIYKKFDNAKDIISWANK